MANPWLSSTYFKDDDIKWPEKTDPELVKIMDKIREYSHSKVVIHRVHDPSAKLATSRHRLDLCDACDFHFEPLDIQAPKSLFQQFMFLTRFVHIMGLGIYPHWNSPGFHVDLRPEPMRVYWIRGKDGLYLPVNDKTIKAEVLGG